MRIAIAGKTKPTLFTKGFITALESRQIKYDLIELCPSNAISQLSGYDGLLWHVSFGELPDCLIGFPILSALAHAGFSVFPSPKDFWHCDDKLSQKYLFDALTASAPKTDVFLSYGDARRYAIHQAAPFILKLRGGAASSNVWKISNNTRGALKLLKCFSIGHRQFDRARIAADAFHQMLAGNRLALSAIYVFLLRLARVFIPSPYERIKNRERGYAICQQAIEANDFDTRIVVIGNRAFGIRRFNRPNDFRASGSGLIDADPTKINTEMVKQAFVFANRLGSQCLGFDFLVDKGGSPSLIEICFGVNPQGYRKCSGYWDQSLKWHQSRWPDGQFHFEDFIVEDFLRHIAMKKLCQRDIGSRLVTDDPWFTHKPD